MSKQIPTVHEPPSGGVTLPESLPTLALADALEPLFSLLGISSRDVVGEGFSITEDAIEGRSVMPIAGVKPLPMSVGEGGVWTWPFRVEIEHR